MKITLGELRACMRATPACGELHTARIGEKIELHNYPQNHWAIKYVDFLRARKHQPDGEMCLACARVENDCTALDFESMRVMKKDGCLIIVICSSFKRKL